MVEGGSEEKKAGRKVIMVNMGQKRIKGAELIKVVFRTSEYQGIIFFAATTLPIRDPL